MIGYNGDICIIIERVAQADNTCVMSKLQWSACRGGSRTFPITMPVVRSKRFMMYCLFRIPYYVLDIISVYAAKIVNQEGYAMNNSMQMTQ